MGSKSKAVLVLGLCTLLALVLGISSVTYRYLNPAPPNSNRSPREMLSNGQFEGRYKSIAPSWSFDVWNGGQASGSPSTGLEGEAQQITVHQLPDGGGVYFRQIFPIEAGAVYRFSIWLKSDENAVVRVQLRKNIRFYKIGAARTLTLTPQWQEVVIEGGLEEDVQGAAGVYFLTTGTISVDQASLQNITHEILNADRSQMTIEATAFGIHFNKPGFLSNTKGRPDIDYGAIRLWDDNITWSDIEPQKGQWDFSRFDMIIDYFATGSVDIVYTMGIAPEWARLNPQDKGSVPRDLNDWRSYVRTVGTRYKGRIEYYEIWNEVNISNFSTIDPREFVALARIARQELQAIDPNIKILSPNIDSFGLGFLDAFLFNGGSKYIDIISYHVYPAVYYPEDTLGLHVGVMNIRDNYGLKRLTIWNTEGAPRYTNSPSDEWDRAATARTYLFQYAIGVERFFWYAWDLYTWDNNIYIRLSADDYLHTTAGGDTYNRIVDWLVGKQIVSLSVENNLWQITLLNKLNSKEYILWHYDAHVSFDVPANWNNMVVHTLDGKIQYSDTPSIEIGIEPVLITNHNSLDE